MSCRKHRLKTLDCVEEQFFVDRYDRVADRRPTFSIIVICSYGCQPIVAQLLLKRSFEGGC